jgi:glycosyltransferase involved in cell wall biosynthesis
MRIGIDARLLSEDLTGIGRYTSELSRCLVRKDDEYFFYSPTPMLPNALESDGTRVHFRAAHCRRRISKMLWSQTALPLWAKTDRLDVFWGTTHRLPQFLPKSIAKVVTIHDLVWKHAGDTMRPLSQSLDSRLMPQAIKLADLIIAVSKNTAEEINAEFPAARNKVRVVYPGVTIFRQESNFSSLSSFGIVRPYFLFVGTLEPRKNLRRLLQAFSRLPVESRSQVQCVIAGGRGWGGVDVKTLVKEFGLEKDVISVGFVSDSQLVTLYSNARFLAMPSIYEGFGLPILEAMSFGTPVLASQTSAMPEVVGDAGLLIDPFNVNDISANLHLLLHNDAVRSQLAEQTRKNAARFSWIKAANETMSVFKEAVAIRKNARKFN